MVPKTAPRSRASPLKRYKVVDDTLPFLLAGNSCFVASCNIDFSIERFSSFLFA
jgi:hypothetical protein